MAGAPSATAYGIFAADLVIDPAIPANTYVLSGAVNTTDTVILRWAGAVTLPINSGPATTTENTENSSSRERAMDMEEAKWSFVRIRCVDENGKVIYQKRHNELIGKRIKIQAPAIKGHLLDDEKTKRAAITKDPGMVIFQYKAK